MTRRLVTLASVLSLLLGLTIIALWTRSYWVSDGIVRQPLHLTIPKFHTYSLLVDRGGMQINVHDNYAWAITATGSPPSYEWRIVHLPNSPAGFPAGFPKYFYNHTVIPNTNPPFAVDVHGITLGLWLPTLLLILPPLPWLRHLHRTRRRHIKGLCPHCGYDLRATPTHCPECGLATIVS